MKTMPLVALMMVLSTSGCAQDPGDTATPPETAQPAAQAEPAPELTITGSITNLAEFAALVVPETYVQLVPMPEDGDVGVSTDDQGRLAYNSDLPRLPVPDSAAFSFAVPTIAPGKYFIAAQRLKSQGMTAGQRPIFATAADKKPYLVEIPADAKLPLTVDAGELIVWTH
jgi:hypothetical protein